jgi:hypothetical protein
MSTYAGGEYSAGVGLLTTESVNDDGYRLE